MSTFHIIIQQERRTQPERMAIPIATSIPTGQTIQGPMGDMPEYVAGPVQLHSHSPNHPVRWVKVMVPNPVEKPADWNEEEDGVWPLEIDQGYFEKDVSDPQFVMVAEWDGTAPYVIQHKGDYSARTMGYAGWPDLTKEQYDALAVAAPL